MTIILNEIFIQFPFNYYFEIVEIKVIVIIMVDFLKYILNVFNTNVISDSLEEDDNFIQAEVTAPVDINLVEEIVKILFKRGRAVCTQQLLLGLRDERMFCKWPRCLPTRAQGLERENIFLFPLLPLLQCSNKLTQNTDMSR